MSRNGNLFVGLPQRWSACVRTARPAGARIRRMRQPGPDVAGAPAMRVQPPLDPAFRPAGRARRTHEARIRASGLGVPVALAVEQPGGTVSRHDTLAWPDGHPEAARSQHHAERLLKTLLWARGGSRVHVDGPDGLVAGLRRHYAQEPTGIFDAAIAGQIYLRPLELVRTPVHQIPPSGTTTASLGGHFEGCRIGFDLGASDRKVAAVIDGEVVFSEETAWDPAGHADPAWHYAGIDDSLRRAAARLPRVDAIGGSAAGVYVDNQVRVASLFRAVPRDLFETRVRGLFDELRQAWGGVPFVVVNDGEVTALAGSQMAGAGAFLGIALGSSQAAGYVTRERTLTTWLDELAFVPVDDAADAPLDEWSGGRGCGVQYLSQQAAGRLMEPAGIPVDPGTPLPQQLVHLQELTAAGDPRAARVYATIGTYLGYALLDYRELYDVEHLLVLGRVMTGAGGDVIIERARDVLRAEDPAAGEAITVHTPSERDKRHGQAVAAASLPATAAPSAALASLPEDA
jgi:predicted NBD/HSP70 family sugar kinase